MGSGSLAAMAVFESSWKPNMEVCVPWLPYPANTQFQSRLARRSSGPGISGNLSWYLQRPWLRVQRRCVCDYSHTNGDASQFCQAQ